MRNPFDSRKENKSIKLVKKLQDEADKEWENEINRRREQELNDEAIAKELQAQLEQETGSSSVPSPPPLPTKPREYNSPINIFSNAASLTSTANHSTHSLPTASSSSSAFAIKPLYSISNNDSQQPVLPPRDQNSSKKPVKSYLPSERYKPELQFALASPSPCPSSVFYQKTPKMTPVISPLAALETPRTSTVTKKSNNMTPLNNHNFYSNSENNGNSNSATFSTQPSRPASTQPSSSQSLINRMEMPMPTDVNPTNFQPISTTSSAPFSSSYNNHHHHPPTVNSSHYQPPQYLPHDYDPIVLPLAQQPQHYNSASAVIPVAPSNPLYQNQQQNESNASYFPPPQQQQQQNYPYQPIRQSTSSPAVSLALNSNDIYQHSNYSQQQQQNLLSHPLQHSFNSACQATPPPPPPPPPPSPPQQQYQSTKPPLISTSSSSVFQLPPMSVYDTSSTNISTSTTTKKNSTLAPTNPYYNMQDEKIPEFSKPIISLKPDEEQSHEHKDEDEDDWDNVKSEKTPHRLPTPIAHAAVILDGDDDDDDKESEIDYSDMIYDRRTESTEEKGIAEDEDEEDEDDDWEDTAVDPFDDDFAVHVLKGSTATSATVAGDFRKQRANSIVTSLAPTIQILDPTITKSPASSSPSLEEKVAVEESVPKQDKIEETFEHNTHHQYVEKESKEIEHGAITSMKRQSTRPCLPQSASATHTPAPSFYQPLKAQDHYNRPQSVPLIGLYLPEDKQSKVYPTNTLKAGAPPPAMSANNPYVKKQSIVPATDYGYFKEDDQLQKKILPELPKSATSDVDRHITVSSINPDQRVWIRIQPTDTGKELAERIHIVASYQTRRVTKITTKNGRSISLDNKPLFEDWNEIISFKEGEKWTVDWVPIEHPYVDIITEGKEFMKQLKANFRGSSSK